MRCEESRSELLQELKEASFFLGNCFAHDITHGLRVSAGRHLAEIQAIERKIKVLER